MRAHLLAEILAKKDSMTTPQWRAYEESLIGRKVVAERGLVTSVDTTTGSQCTNSGYFAGVGEGTEYVITVADTLDTKLTEYGAEIYIAARPGEGLAINRGQSVEVSGKIVFICDVYPTIGISLDLATASYELLP